MLLVGYAAGSARPYLAGRELPAHVAVGGAAAGAAWLASGLLSLVLSTGAASFPDVVVQALVAAGWGLLLGPVVCRGAQALSARVPGAAPQQP
jgi:hypothetical protein